MTHRKLLKEESKVKALLLKGMSKSAVASKTGYSRSKVDKIVGRLTHYGEIRAIPGTKNPIIYEDPRSVIPFPPTEGTSSENDNTATVSELTDPADNSSAPDVDISVLRHPGVSLDNVCPDGYVEAHIKGCIRLSLDAVGSFDTIRDPAGFTIGYWTDPKRIRGSTTYSGEIRLLGQSITWQYRVGNRGSLTFDLYPSRIFIDPLKFNSHDEVRDIFVDRANFIAKLFSGIGWKLTNPQINGRLEYADRDSPLVGLITKDQIPPDGDIDIDTSFGVPEAEIKEPSEFEKVQIWMNTPTEILKLKRENQSQGEQISQLDATSHDLEDRVAHMEAHQEFLESVIEKQARMLDSLLNNSDKLIQIGANLLTIQSQYDTLRLNDFTRDFTGISTPAESRTDRKKNPLEGYN